MQDAFESFPIWRYSDAIVAGYVRVRTRTSARHSLEAKDVETMAAPSATGPGEPHVPAFSNGIVLAGKYLVEETIAQGGIGVVVVAKHIALQQRVAIKYLKTKALSNPAVVERFVREARLAAQITSEHVVRVHDVGALPNAGPYMVMEYLVGEDLGRTIRNGPLPIDRAVDYVLQACDALAEAHALRIVHRDIKPENLFLAQRTSNTPVLKIIDFGISKVSPRRGEDGHWGTETAVTERFGTPLYMSPEQLRSTSNVDTRTDIWSLGVVLYELITGVLPFQGDDLPQVCTSVLTAAPMPMNEVRPSAPPLLEAIVFKCLEKDANHRYRNVAELAQDLAAFGPAASAARVERIAEVVRRGGDSVRPPRPSSAGPGSSRPRTAQHSALDGRRVTTIKVRPSRVHARRAIAAAVTGLACAGLLSAWAVQRSSSGARALAALARSPDMVGAAALRAAADRLEGAAASRPTPLNGPAPAGDGGAGNSPATFVASSADPSLPRRSVQDAPAVPVPSPPGVPAPAVRLAPGAASASPAARAKGATLRSPPPPAPTPTAKAAAAATSNRRSQFGDRE